MRERERACAQVVSAWNNHTARCTLPPMAWYFRTCWMRRVANEWGPRGRVVPVVVLDAVDRRARRFLQPPPSSTAASALFCRDMLVMLSPGSVHAPQCSLPESYPHEKEKNGGKHGAARVKATVLQDVPERRRRARLGRRRGGYSIRIVRRRGQR